MATSEFKSATTTSQQELGFPAGAAMFHSVVCVAPDVTAPTVDNFVPAVGVTISKGTTIKFDVKDDTGAFRKIAVLVEYETGAYEVVWDGDKFATAYEIDSSRSVITNGFRYHVKRRGLWPGAPDIKVIAIDESGNEA